MANRKDRKRRALAEWKTSADRVMEKTKEMYGSNYNIVTNRITENKLSDALTEFAQPMLEHCDTFAQTKITFALVVLIWNSYFDIAKNDNQIIADILSIMGDDNHQDNTDMQEIIADLLQRRRMLFGHDRRLVVNYELTENRYENHLEVAHITMPVPADLPETSDGSINTKNR